MLIVDINTFRLDTEGLCRVDKAREHSVFGIVLKHTACIGRAMNVQSGTVKAGIACPHSILTDQLAYLFRQLIIKGCCNNTVAGIAGTLQFLIRVIVHRGISISTDRILLCHTGRPVVVNGSRFTHRADTHSLPKAGQCEGGHLFIGKLIQEGIPSRIVIVIFQHVYKLQVGFFAHLRELHTGGIRQIRVIQHHVCCQHIRHGKLYKTRCNGAFPVTAGIINDCIISLAFIAVHVCGSKKRGYFSTRAVGCGIGLGIKALIKRINQISISFRSHTVFCSVAFRSKNVVCSLMGVFRRSEIIGPILQNIGAGAKCIIRCEKVFRHSNCKCFALTRLKNLRFVVSDQFYRSLFDLILSVIIRIGFLCIDLDGLLTCCRARVGNRDSHGVRSIFAISLSGNRNIREVKGRVAEPVAERE